MEIQLIPERFEPNWSQLPIDLLGYVMNKLILDDCVRCGSVCLSWRSIFSELIAKKKKDRLLLPFLLIPDVNEPQQEDDEVLVHDDDDDEVDEDADADDEVEGDGDGDEETEDQRRSLYSVSRDQVYHFQVQLPRNKCCRGSCFGWLVTMEHKKPNHFSVQLCNPFLRSNRTINLPTLDTLVEVDEGSRPLITLYLRKAVLSASPGFATNKYVVMAIVGTKNSLAFCMPGNKTWTPINSSAFSMLRDEAWTCTELKKWEFFEDVIYSNKSQQFYALHDTGAVFAIDIVEGKDSNDSVPKLTQIAPPTKPARVFHRYIVESSSGDLLQVFRFVDGDDFDTKFEVHRWDLRTRSWIHMQSLGHNTLFLGDSSSICLSVPGCKPNCIYFTDDFGIVDLPHIQGAGDNGIFNLEDGSIQPHYPLESKKIYPTPIWIEPTLEECH